MLRVKIGSNIDDVNTGSSGRRSPCQEKTTERNIAAGGAHVLWGHDEVGGMDITTGSGGIAKGTVASSAGESDFLGTSSKEGLSSIDMRQQPILPAADRKKLQNNDPEKLPGSDVDGEDLAVQELETDAATATLSKKRYKVSFNAAYIPSFPPIAKKKESHSKVTFSRCCKNFEKNIQNRCHIDSGRFLNFGPCGGSMTSQSKYSPATILSGVTCCVDCGSQVVRGSNDQLLLVRLHCQRGTTQTLPCVRSTRNHEEPELGLDHKNTSCHECHATSPASERLTRTVTVLNGVRRVANAANHDISQLPADDPRPKPVPDKLSC